MAKSVSKRQRGTASGSSNPEGAPRYPRSHLSTDPAVVESLARLQRWERSQACQFRGCRPQHRTEDND